ncbi:unnamed protein product [Cunninghamella blakesleeana]
MEKTRSICVINEIYTCVLVKKIVWERLNKGIRRWVDGKLLPSLSSIYNITFFFFHILVVNLLDCNSLPNCYVIWPCFIFFLSTNFVFFIIISIIY